MIKKAVVLFSGGLDSRLTAKLLEKQGFEIHLVFVKLPFGGGCCNDIPCIINFAQTQGYYLHIIDATKGQKFKEYLELTKNPKYGRGKALNPCKDCKIFIFKQAKKEAKKLKIEVIATGEVIGQRPMSQMKEILLFDEKKAGLQDKILRPLSAKLLPETEYEKNGLVNREKLLSLHGRQRIEQIELAKKYKIKYPTPAGGCLLCEKDYAKKVKCLFDYKNPKYEETLFLKRGRMFKNNGLIFVGRDHKENIFIEEIAKKIKWNILVDEEISGPTVVYDQKRDKKPFSIIVPSIKWINENTEYNKQFKKELNKLPGKFTFILNPNQKLKAKYPLKLLIPERKNIGIRIPNNWFSQELSKINIIFVTTSVNITGEKHMTNLKNINKGIIDKTGYIINEGTIDNKPSTIISLIKNKKIIRK